MAPATNTEIEKLRYALAALKPDLLERFGVAGVSIFGSRARGDASPDSDLDLVLDLASDVIPTLFTLHRIDQEIEATLGLRVDSVERSSLNPRYEPFISSDLVAI